MVDLRKNLIAARHAAGLRQSDASEFSGLCISSIQKIEQGLQKPRRSTLEKLAAAYDTTCSELLAEARPEDPYLYMVEPREGVEWDRWRASLGPSLMLQLPVDLAPLMRGPDAAVWVSGETLTWCRSTPKWIGGSRSPLIVRAKAKVL